MAIPTSAIWLKHSDYPNYRFSPEGEMLSLKTSRISKGTISTPKGRKTGYSVVHIRNKENSWVTRRVHRIVADIYCENIGNKPQVNHIDGNKQNNHFENLEFCTNKENAAHGMSIGLTAKGEKLGKLKNKDILEILEQYKNGATHEEIGQQYLVGGVAIHKVLSGKTWSHITGINSNNYIPNERYSQKLNKYSAAEIKTILAQDSSIHNRKSIADRFGVSICTINDIYKKRAWRNA